MADIATALIAGAAVVMSAVVGVWGKRIDKRFADLEGVLGRVRRQVENDHNTNLREELDDRHKETRRWFEGLRGDMQETRLDIGGLRGDVRNLHERDNVLDARVRRVESTTSQILKEQQNDSDSS